MQRSAWRHLRVLKVFVAVRLLGGVLVILDVFGGVFT